jgi:hypothetical protein
MQLAYTHGRAISELTHLRTSVPVENAPVEFSAEISEAGAALLQAERAAFYRAEDGDSRFTLTIDAVTGVTIAGTIRRR